MATLDRLPTPKLKHTANQNLPRPTLKSLPAEFLGNVGPVPGGSSPLELLPAELLDNIASFLPYTSVLALAWTSTSIYRKLDQSVLEWTPSSHLDVGFDLMILEQWPRFRDHYACCFCHKLLPKDHFTLRQINVLFPKERYNVRYMLQAQKVLRDRESQGKSPVCITKTRRPLVGHQRSLSEEVAGRLCIDCGVREGRYHPGEELHFSTDPTTHASQAESSYGTGIICKVCQRFKVCDSQSRAGKHRICWDCLEETPGFHDKMYQYFDGAQQARKLAA